MPADTPSIFSVSPYARAVAAEMYPGQHGQDDQQDAARHMLAAATLARKYGPEWAERLGRWHEYTTSPLAALKTALGVGQMPPDYAQDLHNNALGAQMAGRARSQAELEHMINLLAEQASTRQQPGRPWVNKARGGLAMMKECSCHG